MTRGCRSDQTLTTACFTVFQILPYQAELITGSAVFLSECEHYGATCVIQVEHN